MRDRSRSMGRKLRAISRTIRRRSGEAKAEVLALTEQTGELLERSIAEARKLAAATRRKARGRGAKAKLKAAAKLEELADRCEKVAKQIKQRVAGEPITDRLVSLFDPDARPIRKGKLGKPNEFGYVSQLAEVTEHTKRGARGTDPASLHTAGQPGRGDAACPARSPSWSGLGIRPREIAVDGGFKHRPDQQRASGPGTQASVHRWPPGTGLQTYPTPAAALPHRRGGPDQPPQTPLRARPIPAEGRPGPADLD